MNGHGHTNFSKFTFSLKILKILNVDIFFNNIAIFYFILDHLNVSSIYQHLTFKPLSI